MDPGGSRGSKPSEVLRVVPAKASVTLGFDLPHKETNRERPEREALADSRSSSKAPSPTPPFEDRKEDAFIKAKLVYFSFQ